MAAADFEIAGLQAKTVYDPRHRIAQVERRKGVMKKNIFRTLANPQVYWDIEGAMEENNLHVLLLPLGWRDAFLLRQDGPNKTYRNWSFRRYLKPDSYTEFLGANMLKSIFGADSNFSQQYGISQQHLTDSAEHILDLVRQILETAGNTLEPELNRRQATWQLRWQNNRNLLAIFRDMGGLHRANGKKFHSDTELCAPSFRRISALTNNWGRLFRLRLSLSERPC